MLRRLSLAVSVFACVFSSFFMTNAAADSVKTPAALFFPQVNTIGGNPNGKITLVEFSDANCGYCKQLSPMVEKIARMNPDVRIVYRDLPVLGPDSTLAARVAIAAGQQGKYVPMHNAIFGAHAQLSDSYLLRLANSIGVDTTVLRQDLSERPVSAQLRSNQADANMLGIDGVPVVVIAPTPDKASHSSVEALVYVAPSYGEMQNAINSVSQKEVG